MERAAVTASRSNGGSSKPLHSCLDRRARCQRLEPPKFCPLLRKNDRRRPIARSNVSGGFVTQPALDPTKLNCKCLKKSDKWSRGVKTYCLVLPQCLAPTLKKPDACPSCWRPAIARLAAPDTWLYFAVSVWSESRAPWSRSVPASVQEMDAPSAPREALERLVAATVDGSLDTLCERFEVRLLCAFGSAARSGETAPKDLDIGVSFRRETNGPHGPQASLEARLALWEALVDLSGCEQIDLVVLDVDNPVLRSEASWECHCTKVKTENLPGSNRCGRRSSRSGAVPSA